jgi:hypothetical protein
MKVKTSITVDEELLKAVDLLSGHSTVLACQREAFRFGLRSPLPGTYH